MSTAAEEELQALYDDLWQNRIVNYVTISCVAFLVYDILTNLDREVPLIWRYYNNANNDEHLSWRGRARRILVQMLFVFGRYYALLYLVGWFTGTVFFSRCLLLLFWRGNTLHDARQRYSGNPSQCDVSNLLWQKGITKTPSFSCVCGRLGIFGRAYRVYHNRHMDRKEGDCASNRSSLARLHA